MLFWFCLNVNLWLQYENYYSFSALNIQQQKCNETNQEQICTVLT